MILLGFSLSAVSALISFINDVNSVGYPTSFRGIFDSLVNPLGTIVALCAWSFLTRLEARDQTQLRLLRLAYALFAAEYLLYAAGYNFIFTPIRSFGGLWPTTSLWLEFVGVLVSAIGLYLLSRTLVKMDETERPRVNQP